MKRTTTFLIAGGAVLRVKISSGVTIVVAQGGDDSKPPITGDALAGHAISAAHMLNGSRGAISPRPRRRTSGSPGR